MAQEIVVGRHGRRWAVRIAPDTVPVEEFDTQAAAESAARLLADKHGARVIVDAGADPQGLGEHEDASAGPPEGGRPADAGHVLGETSADEPPTSRREWPRENQQGL